MHIAFFRNIAFPIDAINTDEAARLQQRRTVGMVNLICRLVSMCRAKFVRELHFRFREGGTELRRYGGEVDTRGAFTYFR